MPVFEKMPENTWGISLEKILNKIIGLRGCMGLSMFTWMAHTFSIFYMNITHAACITCLILYHESTETRYTRPP